MLLFITYCLFNACALCIEYLAVLQDIEDAVTHDLCRFVRIAEDVIYGRRHFVVLHEEQTVLGSSTLGEVKHVSIAHVPELVTILREVEGIAFRYVLACQRVGAVSRSIEREGTPSLSCASCAQRLLL